MNAGMSHGIRENGDRVSHTVHDRRQLRQDGQACELACLRSRARACGAAARASLAGWRATSL